MEEFQPIVLVAAAAIVTIVVIAIIWSAVRRRRRARALHAPIPLIPFSSGRAPLERPARPGRPAEPHRETPLGDQTSATAWSSATSVTPTRNDRPAPVARDGDVPIRGGTDRLLDRALADTAVVDNMVTGAAVDGASVRYWRPADGTLQFLPGRLEVVAGRDAGQEIRFVRTPGPDGTRVTFGRADGAPYRHVQLREPTVSRAHARMTLEVGAMAGAAGGPPSGTGVGRWRLENLSATNPVVVNGRPLGADGGPSCSVFLEEGDRIEMGEVVFRFHEK